MPPGTSSPGAVLDQFSAILRFAGEIKQWPFAFGNERPEQIEHLDELREHENLLPLLHDRFELFEQRFAFGAGCGLEDRS